MALLNGLENVAKGSSATITLDKTQLMALSSVAADTYFSDSANISRVVVVYGSSAGNERVDVTFDMSQASPSDILSLSSQSRDTFSIVEIIMYDFDGGYMSIPMSDIPAGLNVDLSVTPPPQSAPTPVAWFKLNGDATDASGNGNDGIIHNNVTFVPGRNGYQAAQFDGVSSYISNSGIATSAGLVGSTAKSISLWANITYPISDGRLVGLAGFGNTSGSWGGLFLATIHTYYNKFFMWGYGLDIASSQTAAQNAWQHIVITYNNNIANMYVDGTLVGTLNSQLSMTDSDFLIGQTPYGDQQLIVNGLIQDVRVYNVELTANDVLALTNATSYN